MEAHVPDDEHTEVGGALKDIKSTRKGKKPPAELIFDPQTGELKVVEQGAPAADRDGVVATNMAKEGFF
jgi:hypothetical protein